MYRFTKLSHFYRFLSQSFSLGSGENFHLAQKSERAVFNRHEASGKDLLNVMPKYACFGVTLKE